MLLERFLPVLLLLGSNVFMTFACSDASPSLHIFLRNVSMLGSGFLTDLLLALA